MYQEISKLLMYGDIDKNEILNQMASFLPVLNEAIMTKWN